MTNEEAKEYLLQHESVDDREQSEAVWCAIESLKKQIPKRLEQDSKCPHCKKTVFCAPTGDSNVSWCCNCGQAIDTSDNDD